MEGFYEYFFEREKSSKIQALRGLAHAARPDTAIPLYELVIAECRERGFTVETGVFGADMQVFSQNDGPVTILLDTKEL